MSESHIRQHNRIYQPRLVDPDAKPVAPWVKPEVHLAYEEKIKDLPTNQTQLAADSIRRRRREEEARKG